jgi:apolipoprotein D and lipocalin family protein
MRFYFALLCCAGLFMLAACAHDKDGRRPPPSTVSAVDLNRYIGTWYEIGRYPNSFQKQCGPATADYALQPDGNISVINRCSSPSGIKETRGTAKVVDRQTNARLSVTFFWPFAGDYWILALGSDYEYAVVGTPNYKYLWILSRTPHMDPTLYGMLLEQIKELGFDPARIIITSPKTP